VGYRYGLWPCPPSPAVTVSAWHPPSRLVEKGKHHVRILFASRDIRRSFSRTWFPSVSTPLSTLDSSPRATTRGTNWHTWVEYALHLPATHRLGLYLLNRSRITLKSLTYDPVQERKEANRGALGPPPPQILRIVSGDDLAPRYLGVYL